MPAVRRAAVRRVAARRLAMLALAVLALALLAATPASAQRERILSFDSEITVRPDGWLHVVETIEVRSTGDEIRRGIFRDFPTRSITESGLNYRVDMKVVDIERDSRPEPYFVAPLDAGVRIYIGDRDVLLRPGRYRYRIAYDTSRQLYHWQDRDELYWNVTGDAWAFPIDTASVTVHLPQGAAIEQVDAYTGRRGAQGDDFAVSERQGATLTLATTRALAPGEGLTIAVAWPAGLVARPSRFDVAVRTGLDNVGVVIGAVLLATLLVYFLIAWFRVGRDPRKGVVFPRFEAPDGLSPVAVGYIWNEGFNNGFGAGRALTVAITSLATKRRLVIDDAGDDDYTLSALAGTSGDLPPGERAVHRALFPDGTGSVTFGDTYVPTLGQASSALTDAFDWEYGKAYFRTNGGLWFVGAVVAVAAVLCTLVIDAPNTDARITAAVVSVFASALLTVGTVLLVGVAGRVYRAISVGTPVRPLMSFAQLLGGVAALLAAGLPGLILIDFVAPIALPVAAVPAPMTVIFWFLLRAPTRLGRETLDAIEGYRLYLSVAESDRLNSAGREPEVTEALFEAHLPYAMALGVEEEWTDKVMSKLDTATDTPAEHHLYQSRWYRGRNLASRGAMVAALWTGLGGAASHAMSRPSSGGSSGGFSGGGGSSGGGGGGGGGGGW